MQKNPKHTRTEIFTEENCIRHVERERRDIIDTTVYPEYINYPIN